MVGTFSAPNRCLYVLQGKHALIQCESRTGTLTRVDCTRRLPCCTGGIHAAGGDGPLDRYAQRHGRTAVAITDHACGGGSPVFVHSGLRRLRVHTYGRHRRERRHGRAQVVGGRHILGPEPVSVRASR